MSYLIYVSVKHLARRDPRWEFYYHSTGFQCLRALVLIVGVTGFLLILYGTTPYLETYGGNHGLWMLYLLPLFVMAQRASTGHLVFTLVIAIFAQYVAEPVIGPPIWDPPLGFKAITTVTLTKAIWLGLPSFILYIFVRYLGDTVADLHLISQIQEQLHELESDFIHEPATLDVTAYLSSAVEMVVTDFGYDHVNVFRLEPGRRHLEIVAAGCREGQCLVDAGFVLQLGDQASIIGHVVETGESYVSNAVRRDPHYLPHPAFPDTRSELAIPIRFHNRLYGVLDVQVKRQAYFLDQDLAALEILANHLGWIIDNADQFKHLEWIDGVMEDIAESFFTQEDLEETVQEIAVTAQRELEADLVTLYCFPDDAQQGVIGPIFAGQAKYPDVLRRAQFASDSIIYRIRDLEQTLITFENVHDLDLATHELFSPSSLHRAHGYPPFVIREEISSLAAVRLLSESDCMGVLFLNFRRPRNFAERDRRRYLSFAHLATLAVQKMQSQNRSLRLQRADIANSVHDLLVGDAVGLHKLLRSAQRWESDDHREKVREYLAQAVALAETLTVDIRQIFGPLKEDGVVDIHQEVAHIRKIFSTSLGVSIETHWDGDIQALPPSVLDVLRRVFREAVANAVYHGKANTVSLTASCDSGAFRLVIADDGVGFETRTLRHRGGLANLRERVERLHGSFEVESSPTTGTSIDIQIPLGTAQLSMPIYPDLEEGVSRS